MFEETADWEGVELNSSLSEALLAKPVATPTREGKSKNKYRPNGTAGGKRKKKLEPHVDTTPGPETITNPKGKRKREPKTKAERAEQRKKAKHVKCGMIFDDMTNWDAVITNHEAEDPSGENLAEYLSSAVDEISKENQGENANLAKPKKSKKKKVKFAGQEDSELLSESMTGGAGSALANLNIESDSLTESVPESTTSSLQSAKEKISKLKGKFQKKLDSSQFRHINEKLYTTSGDDAMSMFAKKPELFEVYHRGFTSQAEKWEINPVDRIIDFIKTRGEDCVVADFGCGDAKIARTLTNHAVFSFDLVKCNEHVVVANSSKVPLGKKSVDVSVFCLSLMGTDFKDFIREARRVLRAKGRLVIAEVASRIENLADFVGGVEELGFALVSQEEPNSYFVELIFKKTKPKENHGKFETLSMKSCTYKKR